MSSRRTVDGRPPRRGRRAETVLLATVALALVGLGGVLVVRWVGDGSAASDPGPNRASVSSPAGSPSPSNADGPPVAPQTVAPQTMVPQAVTPVYALSTNFPKSGPRKYRYATTTGPVLGSSGPIRRFRVAIESNLGDVVAMPDLVAKINTTLGDSRSWVGAGRYRLQQVPASSAYQFTIYLVTSHTSSALCAPLRTHGYTSCRQGGRVVLNLERWMTSVPYYVTAKVPLDTYRTYMINHEVGHALGHGHELCPAPGKPAPVMEQQTLGLHGCTPNPWVYVNGKRYDGPSGQY